MLGALLRKELRQLVPWALGMVVLDLGRLALQLMVTPPDELRWVWLSAMFSNSTAQTMLLLLAAVVFAYSGFPREHDERTLPFLFSLPVSRARLFVAKWLAAALLLAAFVLVQQLARWLVQLPNQTSYGQTFRLDWALVASGVSVAAAWIYLGHAFFLSIFRRFGLLLGALLYVLVQWVVWERPAWRRLDILDLLRVEFEGTVPLVAWRALALHLAVATLAAALAGWVWVGPAERVVAAISRGVRRAGAQALFVLGAALALVVTFWWLDRDAPAAQAERSGSFGTVVELTSAEARLDTARYEFRHPTVLRERVERLAAPADALHDAIAAQLGVPPREGRVLVNLMQSSSTHAGSASWQTIRLDLWRGSDETELLRTLAHETAHVLALAASERRIATHHRAFGVFDEGLAEAIAFEHVPDPARLEARWFEAVLLRDRWQLEFADLADHAGLKRRFGIPAMYSLGLVWVDALSETCGAEAARGILHTLAAPDTPVDAPALGLWRHVLQNLRCDLARVEATWRERLADQAKAWRAELDAVPVWVGGAPAFTEQGLSLRAELEGQAPEHAAYQLVLRAPASGDLLVVSTQPAADGSLVFEIPAKYAEAEFLEYQLNMAWQRQGATVYARDEWRRALLEEP